MSKTSNILLFTEILNKCNFNGQNEETKKKLHVALTDLLKKAQDKCITQLTSLQMRGVKLDEESKEVLKRQARNLMHSELETLINSNEFIKTCRDIIISTQRPNYDQISDSTKQCTKSNSPTRSPSTKSSVGVHDNKISSTKPNSPVSAPTSSVNSKTETHSVSSDLNLDYNNKSNKSKRNNKTQNNLDNKKFDNNKDEVDSKKTSPERVKVHTAASPVRVNSSSQKLLPVLKVISATLNNKITENKSVQDKNLYSIRKRRSSHFNNFYNQKLKTESPSSAITTSTQSHTIIVKPQIFPKVKSNNSNLNYKKRAIPISNDISNTLYGSQLARFQRIRETVEQAIQTRKIFMMGSYSIVSCFLANRGWIEKIIISRNCSEIQQIADRMSILQLFNNLDDHLYGRLYLRVLKSKLIGDNICDLYWHPRPYIYSLVKNVNKPIYINHLPRRGEYDFCSKIGLCRHMRNLRWYHRRGVADVYFPRTYITSDNEMDNFIFDFRITACLAMLKWVQNRAKNKTKPFISNQGKVPIDAFYFAVLQCIGFIKRCKDCDFNLNYSILTWNNFIDHYYQCIYREEHFYSNENENVQELIQQTSEILKRIENYRPEMYYEGIYNIWIVKPDRNCRGQGIHVCRRMCQIKEILQRNYHIKYLIQKYIEKPLLIYNTKFDIRQWFLISSSSPLTVWIYQ